MPTEILGLKKEFNFKDDGDGEESDGTNGNNGRHDDNGIPLSLPTLDRSW